MKVVMVETGWNSCRPIRYVVEMEASEMADIVGAEEQSQMPIRGDAVGVCKLYRDCLAVRKAAGKVVDMPSSLRAAAEVLAVVAAKAQEICDAKAPEKQTSE